MGTDCAGRPRRPCTAPVNRRLLLTVLLGLPVLLVSIDSAVWWWMTSRMIAGFDGWRADLRNAGWMVSTADEPRRGGWPLAAALAVSGLSLSGGDPDVPGGIDWGAEGVLLRLSPFQPNRLAIDFQGAQHLRLGNTPVLGYT